MKNPYFEFVKPSVTMTDEEISRRIISQAKVQLYVDGKPGHTLRNALKQHVTREWLRHQLQATKAMYPLGTTGPRSIEVQLDNIRDGMGYKAFWQMWGLRILHDADCARWCEEMWRTHGDSLVPALKAASDARAEKLWRDEHGGDAEAEDQGH